MNDPFALLHANLGALASLAASHHWTYSLDAIHVELNDNGYAVAATDAKRLGIVDGKSSADPLAFPTTPELAEAPASQPSALIPSELWKSSFREAARVKDDSPCAGAVAVHLGKDFSLLAHSSSAEVTRIDNVQGRFPPYQSILPQSAPLAKVTVDASFLIDLLKLAQTFGPGRDKAYPVTIELRGENVPIVLRASNDEQSFTGVLMPLTEVK